LNEQLQVSKFQVHHAASITSLAVFEAKWLFSLSQDQTVNVFDAQFKLVKQLDCIVSHPTSIQVDARCVYVGGGSGFDQIEHGLEV
jgi:hypothetical protein